MKKILCLFTSVIFISGCASTVRGKTAVNKNLKNDTYKMLSSIASGQLDCEKIEYADVIASSVSGDTATETWRVHGCHKTKDYSIQFMPSKLGGYTFSIEGL